MNRITTAALAAACPALFALGCQHIPPQPLDMQTIHAGFAERNLDVEPIKRYAAELAEDNNDPTTGFDTSDGLTLDEAQAVALWYNPDLRIARLDLARSQAVAEVAGKWLDPETGLSLGRKEVESSGTSTIALEDGGDTLSYSRTEPEVDKAWILAGSLIITVPLSGRLGAQRDLAQTQVSLAQLTVAEAEWQMLARLREAWLRWSASRARLDLLQAHLEQFSEFSSTTEALAAAGEVAPSSARLFLIERLRVQAEYDRENALAAEQRIAILRLLGLLPDVPVDLTPQLGLAAPAETAWPEAAHHPSVARLRAAYQEAEDRLRLELRKQYPDLTISPTYTDEEDETSLVLGLGMPVPVWNANRQGIAEAAGARDVARARVEAAYQDLLAKRAQAAAALAGMRAQRQQLLEKVAPLVEEQMKESLALLRIGELDVIVLYETLTQILQTKQTLIDTALAESLAAADLVSLRASDVDHAPSSPEVAP